MPTHTQTKGPVPHTHIIYLHCSTDSQQTWLQLPMSLSVESTQSAVEIILGKKKEAQKHITTSVPLGFQGNGSFLVDTSHLSNAEDIKCDDNGGWVNSGVRKLWLQIPSVSDSDHSGTDPDEGDTPMITKVIKRGGSNPDQPCWCLNRTYFKSRCSDDFKKVITTLIGKHAIGLA